MFEPFKSWIAREDITKGDLVVILWKNYMRPARKNDVNIVGISYDNVKKGQKGTIIVSINNTYEVDITDQEIDEANEIAEDAYSTYKDDCIRE